MLELLCFSGVEFLSVFNSGACSMTFFFFCTLFSFIKQHIFVDTFFKHANIYLIGQACVPVSLGDSLSPVGMY